MNNTNSWLPFLEWDSINHTRSGGISLDMINDVTRNVFYEKIISEECNGRICIDIGTGNGLLTFLAITHGATHVYCFEADPYTCQLLEAMANNLGFSNKITIINDIFKLSKFQLFDWSKGRPEVIIHEIVGDKLFNDRLTITTAFDCKIPDNLTIVPSKYNCNVYSAELTEQSFNNVIAHSKLYAQSINNQSDFVKTGVSELFDQALQKYRSDFLNLPYQQIYLREEQLKTINAHSTFVGAIEFNINSEGLFPSLFSLNIKPSQKHRMIFLHFELGHNDSFLKFDFDNAISHFGQGVVYAIEPNLDTVNISTNKGTVWFE